MREFYDAVIINNLQYMYINEKLDILDTLRPLFKEMLKVKRTPLGGVISCGDKEMSINMGEYIELSNWIERTKDDK